MDDCCLYFAAIAEAVRRQILRGNLSRREWINYVESTEFLNADSDIVSFREISRLAGKCETVLFVGEIRSYAVMGKVGEVVEKRFGYGIVLISRRLWLLNSGLHRRLNKAGIINY